MHCRNCMWLTSLADWILVFDPDWRDGYESLVLRPGGLDKVLCKEDALRQRR